MKSMKLNTEGLSANNLDNLQKYFKFYKIFPDENGNVPIKFNTLQMVVMFSKNNSNASKLLKDNEELICAILSNTKLNNSQRSFIKFVENKFINAVLTLTT